MWLKELGHIERILWNTLNFAICHATRNSSFKPKQKDKMSCYSIEVESNQILVALPKPF